MDDYIRKLTYLLDQSNREDKHAYLQYLLEMIEDMHEMGLSEQEIMANLGPVESLVNGEDGNNPVNFPLEVVAHEHHDNSELNPTVTFKHNEIKAISIEVLNLELSVKQSNDLTHYVCIDKVDQVEVSCQNQELVIENHSLKGLNTHVSITLYLPKYHYLDQFSIETVNGQIDINDFENAQSTLEIDTVNGQVKLSTSLFKEINISSINSSVSLDSIQARIANIDSVAADINGITIKTDELNIDTINGGVDLTMAYDQQSYSLSIDAPFVERKDYHNGGKPINIETMSGLIDVKFAH